MVDVEEMRDDGALVSTNLDINRFSQVKTFYNCNVVHQNINDISNYCDIKEWKWLKMLNDIRQTYCQRCAIYNSSTTEIPRLIN